MKNNTKTLTSFFTFTFLTFFIFSSKLYADDSKFSIGLGITNNNIEFIPSEFTDNGFKFDLGYSINDIFSVELSYFDFGNIGFESFNLTGPEIPEDAHVTVDFNIKALDLSVLAKHKWDKFSIFAKIGWLASDNEEKVFIAHGLFQQFNISDSNFSYGAGMGYDINKNFMINFDYTASNLDANVSVKISSLGVKYRF